MRRRRFTLSVEGLEYRLCPAFHSLLDVQAELGSVAPAGHWAYFPQDLRKVYGAPSYLTANGAGETVAIVIAYHSPTLLQDVATFDKTFGLGPAAINVTNLAGGSSDPDWGLEEALDVEMVHAFAPAATIDVVEAASADFGPMEQACHTAEKLPGVSIETNSWGVDENTLSLAAERRLDAAYFPRTAGIVYLASSGDDTLPNWPAASPRVLAVGGTTLYTIGGRWSRETAWNDGYGDGQGAGRVQDGGRSIPEVGFVGDPLTGVAMYAEGSYYIVGGTSVGSPAWAGITALLEQSSGQHYTTTQYRRLLADLPSDFRHVKGTGDGTPRIADLVRHVKAHAHEEAAPTHKDKKAPRPSLNLPLEKKTWQESIDAAFALDWGGEPSWART